MAAVPTPTRLTEDGRHLGTYVHIGEMLDVSTNQAWTWARRRATSGFPDPVPADVHSGPSTGHRMPPWYDLAEVRLWHAVYRPARGGATRGNQRALKHGRYSGTEAAKQARGYVRPARRRPDVAA
jgi:hypothetical protein